MFIDAYNFQFLEKINYASLKQSVHISVEKVVGICSHILRVQSRHVRKVATDFF